MLEREGCGTVKRFYGYVFQNFVGTLDGVARIIFFAKIIYCVFNFSPLGIREKNVTI